MTSASRNWLVGTAIGVCVALLLWGGTRWLVLLQFRLALGGSYEQALLKDLGVGQAEPGAPSSGDAVNEAAARQPDQPALQVAAVLCRPGGSKAWMAGLRELRSRFPDSALVCAETLRIATMGEVVLHRPEGDWLVGGSTASRPVAAQDPAAVTAFVEDARHGEQLEPGNAYFPAMLSVGLFAQGHDAEARDALVRASRCPAWHEYWADTVKAHLRAREEKYGNTGSIPRAAVMCAVVFPHLAQLRQGARVAVWQAAEDEKAGRTEEGLATRLAVMRVGDLMRTQQTSAITSLVGVAIASVAQLRPGGEAPLRPRRGTQRQDPAAQQLARFTGYLDGIGRADIASAARSQAEAGIAARNAIRAGVARSVFDTGSLWQLGTWWCASMVLLLGAVWAALMAAGAGLAGRSAHVRRGRPLTRPVRLGIGAAAVAIACAAAMSHETVDGALSASFVVMCVWAAVAAAALVGGRRRGRSALVFVATGSVALAATWLVVHQGLAVGTLVWIGSALSDTSAIDAASMVSSAPLIWASIAALLPTLMVLVLAVVSLVCRVPVSVGVVRGLPRLALPAACVLILLYAGAVVRTARLEAAATDGLNQVIRDEGRYLSGLAGVEWPGPVALPEVGR